MALGTSLFLIAVGAILRFAVHVTTHGFSVHTIGLILLIVGIVGLVISMLWMGAWSGRRDRVVVDREVARERDVPADRTAPPYTA